jgi:hypothetical protein
VKKLFLFTKREKIFSVKVKGIQEKGLKKKRREEVQSKNDERFPLNSSHSVSSLSTIVPSASECV